MAGVWLTLSDAADELDVSPRTIRRWVHAGKVPAELRPAAHGRQYFLPTEAVRQLQASRDLEQPSRRVELERVVELVSGYLDARERTFQEQQDALRDELQVVREQLRQFYADLTRAQQAIWQQCQELAETHRMMQQLGDTLNATRAKAQVTRDLTRQRRSAQPQARDEAAG